MWPLMHFGHRTLGSRQQFVVDIGRVGRVGLVGLVGLVGRALVAESAVRQLAGIEPSLHWHSWATLFCGSLPHSSLSALFFTVVCTLWAQNRF